MENQLERSTINVLKNYIHDVMIEIEELKEKRLEKANELHLVESALANKWLEIYKQIQEL